jgi:hypothetical protein
MLTEEEKLSHIRESKKKWADANKEKIRDKNKHWAENNKEVNLERQRKYRAANRDNFNAKASKYQKQWRKENPEKASEKEKARYLRTRKDNPEWQERMKDNQRRRDGRVDSGRRKGVVQSTESLYIKSIKSDSKKKHYLKKMYNITIDEWNKIIENQGGCCYICGRHFSSIFGGACVDHDHETGKVRGALCRRCNAGLGNFSDKVNLLQKAIAYLLGS